MAVTKVPQGTVMSIKVQSGVTTGGLPAYKTTRFTGVKDATVDADFYEIANALADLQSYPLSAIQRTDTADMVNA